MKKVLLYSIFSLSILFTSCKGTFQVFETTSDDVNQYEDNALAFEDEHVAVSYDFWAYGGLMAFNVYNKGEETIYLDLSESTFSINGERITYDDRRYSTAHPVRNISSIKRIPQGKSLTIEAYPVTDRWYKLGVNVPNSQFEKETTPFKIKNQIKYGFDIELTQKIEIENTFWVESINRIRRKEFRTLDQYDTNKSGKFFVSKDPIIQDPVFFWAQIGIDLLYLFF